MKRLIILLALVVINLSGCFIEPEFDRGDKERHQRHHGDEGDDHEGHGDHDEHEGHNHGYH